MHFGTAWVLPGSNLDVSKSSFVQTEVVSEFVEHGLPDFMADFRFGGANSLDVLLIENDAIRSGRQIKNTSLCGRPALKDSQNQVTSPARAGFLSGLSPSRWAWLVFDQNCEIVETLAEFKGKRLQDFLHHSDKVLSLHTAPG